MELRPKQDDTSPLIRYGWLRAVVFFIALYAVMLMVLSQLMPPQPSGAVTEADNYRMLGQLVAISTVLSFLFVWVFRRYIDRRSFISVGFPLKGNKKHAFAGLLLALALPGIATLALMGMGYLRFSDAVFDGIKMLLNLTLMVAVAFGEELAFRGYILNNLMESTNKWVALIISSVLFALVHSTNPGSDVLPLLSVFVAGLLLGINYIYTRNLWFGICFHFGWNFVLGPILGYEVSGLSMNHLLQQELQGPALWTGGSFGLEGSLLAILLNLLAVLLLAKVYGSRKQAI